VERRGSISLKVQSVKPYTRRAPTKVKKATGGFVSGPTKVGDQGNSVTLRSKPVTEFDDQHGGKGPLRDGYGYGGAIRGAMANRAGVMKPAGGAGNYGGFRNRPLIK
jgi:hypothetical protein